MKNKITINSIYNTVYRGFNAIFPLLVSAYVSHVLFADGVGKVTYANTIATYFSTLAALGLPSYGVKAIAKHKNNESDKNKTFIELFIINLISTMIFSISYYYIINSFSYFSTRTELFNVMGLMVILNIFNIEWFFQGIEEYGYIAKRSILMKVVSFILLIIFVKNPDDYINYAFILCVGTAGNFILNLSNLGEYLQLDFRIHIEIKHHLKPVFILLASTLATEVYTMLDTLMIEYYFGESHVAYYTYSVKIVRTIYAVTVAMVATFYPQISYYFQHKKTSEASELINNGIKIILLISIPCVIGLYSISDLIIPILFGESFIPSIITTKILCPLIFVFSIAYFLGHIVLMSNNKENIILISTIVGAVVNFLINSILIPSYAHCGAAFASVIAEIIVTSIVIGYGRRYYKIQISRNYLCSILISNLFLLICVNTLDFIHWSSYIELIMKIICGILIYIVCLFVTRNEIVTKILIKLKKR